MEMHKQCIYLTPNRTSNAGGLSPMVLLQSFKTFSTQRLRFFICSRFESLKTCVSFDNLTVIYFSYLSVSLFLFYFEVYLR